MMDLAPLALECAAFVSLLSLCSMSAVYRTRAIISRGLYTFLPPFHFPSI